LRFWVIHLHNLYEGLKSFFPSYDITNAWLKSFISIWGLLTIDNEMDALARENGIELPPPKYSPILGIFWVTGPLMLTSQMERANILCLAMVEKNG